MSTGYWHTGITVSDAARTAEYFRTVLGLEISEPYDLAEETSSTVTGVKGAKLRAIFASNDAITIEILQYATSGPAADASPPDRVGAAHIALIVDDLDRVLAQGAKWGRRLMAGIHQSVAGPRKGWRICYTVDGDGIVIEFAQPAPAA